MHVIIKWANENQGVLELILLISTFIGLLYAAFRKFRSKKSEKERLIREEFTQAEDLKKEVEAKTTWDDNFSHYGEFLIRDTTRRLPESDEAHSSITTPYSIAALIKIHSEYLEFTNGSFSIRHIKKIADGWYFSDSTEEGSIKAQVVFRINYRDIVTIRWETNDYWEWPQICCRFTASNKFPFSRVYYAKEEKLGSRNVLLEICPLSDVRRKPNGYT